MQIAHILRKEFLPERFDTLLVFSFWIISIVMRCIWSKPNHWIGVAATLVSIFDCSRFIAIVTLRLAKILRINILTITPKK